MSLAHELLDRWAPMLDGIELKTGSKGRFEVYVDAQVVFSKAKLDRFPAKGEMIKLLEPRLGAPPEWRSTH